MFFPESRVRVYLYGLAVDMRKSFDGLYAVARAAFPQDPTGGDLYVFVNRSGRQIKVLYFDRSGWCVWAKRLEAGRFISDWPGARTREIDCTQLKLLLEGIEPRRYLKRYHHPSGHQSSHQSGHPNSGVEQAGNDASHSGTRHRGQGNSDYSRGAKLSG
jgi:transposase